MKLGKSANETTSFMTTDASVLSERERAVLRLVATGATNQQIADQLDISPNTVKVHLRNIFGKIGAASRTEATMFAVRTGLVAVGATIVAVAEAPDLAADLPVAEPSTGLERIEAQAAPAEPVAEQAAPVALIVELEAPALPQRAPVSPEPPQSAPVPRTRSPWLLGLLALLAGAVLALAGVALASRVAPTSAVQPTSGVLEAAPSGTWVLRKAPGRAVLGSAAINSNGPLLLIAGQGAQDVQNSVQRYDPINDVWADLPAKPTAVRDVQAATLGGKVYVPGGVGADGKPIAVLEIYDLQAKHWTTGPALPAPRSAYGLAVVDGQLYLFGGWDGGAYRDEVLRLDPSAGAWSEQKPMPTRRAHACVAVVGGSDVYVIGGENSAGALFTNEQFTPANADQPWQQRTPLPAKRSKVGCGVADNEIDLFGGASDGDAPLSYDARSDAWMPLASPPEPLGAQPAVAYRDGSFYIIGGGSDADPRDRLYQFRARYSVTVP